MTALLLFCQFFSTSCSPDSPLPIPIPEGSVDCSTVELTYEGFGKGFLQDYCLRCHSVSKEDDWPDRLDAPQGINFDSLDMAREFESRIRLRAGELGDMPPRLIPGNYPSVEERIRLIEWIDCGMLSEQDFEGG